MSSSQPVVERRVGLINDGCMSHHSTRQRRDEESLRSTSQAFLECLDRHDHPRRLDGAYKRIIRICIAEILANYQSEAATNEGSWKYNNTDLQTASGLVVKPQTPVPLDGAMNSSSTDFSFPPQPLALQHSQGQVPGQGYGHLSQGSVVVASIQSEETDPALGQRLPDFLLFGTAGSVGYELGAQPSYSSAPQHGMRAEGQSLSGPSADHHQELHLPVAQGGQERVKCTWPGCSKSVGKDSYNRHGVPAHIYEEEPRTYLSWSTIRK
ncbi:hypothetical protein K503DRAFT_868961 [Rhizopogon vinicolor AM-OR11-026]|uniref:Uncharacterized protein n=1 Tax=Rhizopogon vinicolor AM-OR11-026 TaxID=1314800 RepID=A0A1B7MP39_9AGAM|nr:hypothetical protein K503DRAFT_868961 [Rhizopogon vinicolor AM-OR11-026]